MLAGYDQYPSANSAMITVLMGEAASFGPASIGLNRELYLD
ncbi:hypothetical protein [Arthrobacter glacialis]|nr:hypothetical protein [Arthrobacter glacialis]